MPKVIKTTPKVTSVRTEVYRTAESVSPKHPDKICDQISDAILDAHLKEDPFARVAVDVSGAHGKLFIAGEVTSVATSVNISAIVQRIAGKQQNGKNLEIIESIAVQSPEIAQGVNSGGAGDQGIMVGYAVDETPELLPLEYVLARNLNKFLYEQWPYDGKTQVTIKGDKIIAIVASFQHAKREELARAVETWLEHEPLAHAHPHAFQLHVNPAGDWEIGGFDADSGLTGRKLAVDNYGPRVPLGGGAFSGKDGTKVDRSGAYIARQIAIEYLRKHRAHEVFVYLAYAIGYPQPVEATVVIDGVQKQIKGYDLTPEGIIKKLNLRSPGFEKRAKYGHF
jgi:S-adenosylmethionine synthetase